MCSALSLATAVTPSTEKSLLMAVNLAIGCRRAPAAARRRSALDAVPGLLRAAEQDRRARRQAGQRTALRGQPDPARGRDPPAARRRPLLRARRPQLPDLAVPGLSRQAR